MRKKIIIVSIVIAAALGAWYMYWGSVVRPVPSGINRLRDINVTVVIDSAIVPVTFSHVGSRTAYDALVSAARAKNLTVKTKTYDFGSMVEQIGDRINTKDKAWIYYVNGKSGTVASDKMTIQSGDTVEWKYEKPIFE